MKRRWVLLNPGPVNVTARVRRALAGPDVCHREPEFAAVLKSVRRRLLDAFGLERSHTVAVLTGSGTAALEAMLSSFANRDKKVLVLSNGVYGDRIRTILERYGTPVKVLSAPLGCFPSLTDIEQTLRADASIRSVAMAHHETSTGMLNPLNEVSRIAQRLGRTMLVDAVSSLGAERIDWDRIGLCAGSAGKCLNAYPGVAFVFLSKKEAAGLSRLKPRSLYLDLQNTLAYEEKDDTPFTPAVQLFYAFDEALKELQKETVAKRIRVYARRAALLESGFRRMGLRFLVDAPHRSHVLTSLWMPPQIPYSKLHAGLKKAGFIIYAGQSQLAGKIFRVSNLGAMTDNDLRRFLKELSRLLKTK